MYFLVFRSDHIVQVTAAYYIKQPHCIQVISTVQLLFMELTSSRSKLSSFELSRVPQPIEKYNEFLVSKETVVLRRWERSKQKFGFIKRVDEG